MAAEIGSAEAREVANRLPAPRSALGVTMWLYSPPAPVLNSTWDHRRCPAHDHGPGGILGAAYRGGGLAGVVMSRRPRQAVRAPRGARMRSALRHVGRPHGRDVAAGLVTGLISILEGMGLANIGGFSPAAGLYSGMVRTLVGSVFSRTVPMEATLTSARPCRPALS
jgi:Sulfate permease family